MRPVMVNAAQILQCVGRPCLTFQHLLIRANEVEKTNLTVGQRFRFVQRALQQLFYRMIVRKATQPQTRAQYGFRFFAFSNIAIAFAAPQPLSMIAIYGCANMVDPAHLAAFCDNAKIELNILFLLAICCRVKMICNFFPIIGMRDLHNEICIRKKFSGCIACDSLTGWRDVNISSARVPRLPIISKICD